MRRILTVLICLFTVAVGTSAQGTTTSSTARLERSEIRFLEGMSDHHQMAVDMANDCLAKASTPEVTELCQAVIDAQTPEIEQMQAWLLDWYNIRYEVMPMDSMMGMMDGGMGGMDHGSMNMPATDPAMMMGMFAGFNRLEGIDYEIAWLEAMIDHHDDAIHMSERLLARGTVHDELAALAEQIIADQTAEIEAIEALLALLSAE